MDGEGTLTWPTGKQYEGNFLNNKRHGYGVFTWEDGHCYKGNWKNGK